MLRRGCKPNVKYTWNVFCVNTRKNDAKIKLTRLILNEPVCVMTARARWRWSQPRLSWGRGGGLCSSVFGCPPASWGDHPLGGPRREQSFKPSIFNFLVKILFVYRAGGRSIFHLAHFGFFSH